MFTDNERQRFRRPVSPLKTSVSENNIPDGKADVETAPSVNRFKLYHRTSKPVYKRKPVESSTTDLDTAASVNRPTILHRHVTNSNNSSDAESHESSTIKVTRLHSRRGSKPHHDTTHDIDQDTAPSINRNNIQRRISKPGNGNSLLENESATDNENAPTTNRLKIRRRISKPENLNLAVEESKTEDQETSLSNRFKVRQKLAASSNVAIITRKSGHEDKDDDGYKVKILSFYSFFFLSLYQSVLNFMIRNFFFQVLKVA